MSSTKKSILTLLIIVLITIAVFILIQKQEALPAIQPVYTDNTTLPDFAKLANVQQKKTSFFAYLSPIIELENTHVLIIRERLKLLGSQEFKHLTTTQKLWLFELATYYKIKHKEQFDVDAYKQLLKRVDTIPVSLGLTQAALESAWGTSRFAKQGNNLFGQWCFVKGCGIVPSARSVGKSHEVAKFERVNESVHAYIHNLNTHPSYEYLRQTRLESRQKNIPVTGQLLAQTLAKYSEEGDQYVEKITRFLDGNNLE